MRAKTRVVVVALMVAALARSARAQEEDLPIEGFTPRETIENFVSIPGNPLPPLPKEAVEDAIPIQELIVTGVSFFPLPEARARSIGYLATLHAAVGRYERADQLFDEAQSILANQESNGRDLGWLHNNRGLVRMRQKRYADSVRSFHAALHVMNPDDPDLIEPRARVTQNLAASFHALGDFEHAESAYDDALGTLRRLKDSPPETEHRIRANLGLLHASIGSFEQSRAVFQDLLRQRSLSPALRFAVLNNLGRVLMQLEDYKGAELRLLEAKDLSPSGSRMRALALTNLSTVHFEAMDFEQARRVAESALYLSDELYGVRSSKSAILTGSLGSIAFVQSELPKAERLLTEAHGILSKKAGTDEVIAGLARMLALVAQVQGNRDRAVAWSRTSLDLEKKNLERVLAFGSEAQRLAYRRKQSPYDQLANLGDAHLLAEAVLTMKGAVLESLLVERALVRKNKAPRDEEELCEIHDLKVALMEKVTRGGSGVEKLRQELKSRETNLTKRLALPAAQERSRVDLSRVRTQLAEDQVLIEIIRFEHYDGKGLLTPWYGGVVIPASGNPLWVPLGSAAPLESLITDLLERLDRGMRGFEPSDVPHGDVGSLLSALHDRIWSPLERALPKKTSKIVLSPDGATHFIPWAVLVDDQKKFLIERWALTQVSSGRDLLRTERTRSDKTVLALADGKGDLPFSRKEVEALARLAKVHGWQTTLLVGTRGSESAVSRYPHPRILHFATHGGENPNFQANDVQDRLSTNPMYRGFLLLGNYQHTKRAADDGILTAEEAAGLDLRNTWLTVLSACRSGAGDARIGEGVLGLRRGFTMAGTENLAFTLWSVDDEATAQFMEAFYERLFASNDIGESFRTTQIEGLRLWKKAGGISEAVFRAGAFVLTK